MNTSGGSPFFWGWRDDPAPSTSRDALWQVVEGYITRWRVEETIRHVKQSYRLEDMRLFKYGKIKAMAYPPNEVSIVKQCR